MKLKLSLIYLSLMTLLLVSCEKEKNYLDNASSGSSSQVGYGVSNGNAIIVNVDATATSLDTAINIFLSSKSGNSANIVASIVVDTATVGAYNTANDLAIANIPADVFTYPSTVTIPSGSKEGVAVLKVDIQKLLTYGIEFGVGLKITQLDGSGTSIQSDNNSALVIIRVKNKYDGQYAMQIKTVGWDAYGISDNKPGTWPTNFGLVTAGTNSVTFYDYERSGDALQPAFTTDNAAATGFGATSPKFTFDLETDKLIDVVNTTPDDGRGRAFMLNPAVSDSRYDADSKTIYAAYVMLQNGRPNMLIYDTLVYVKSR